MASVKLHCLTILCAALAVAIASITVRADLRTCESVLLKLEPCLSYVQAVSSVPSPSCCDGVKIIINDAKTTDDRQMTCKCIKEEVKEFPFHGSISVNRTVQLPTICRINMPYNVSSSTDCKSIK